MRMRGGRMIVNPVRYGSGSAVKQYEITVNIPYKGGSIYYISDGEPKNIWSNADGEQTILVDAGTYLALEGEQYLPTASGKVDLMCSSETVAVYLVRS